MPSVKAYLAAMGVDLKDMSTLPSPAPNAISMPQPPVATSLPAAPPITLQQLHSPVPGLPASTTPQMPPPRPAHLATPMTAPPASAPAYVSQAEQLPSSAPPRRVNAAPWLPPFQTPVPPTPQTSTSFPTPAPRAPLLHPLAHTPATPINVQPGTQSVASAPHSPAPTPAPHPGSSERLAQAEVKVVSSRAPRNYSDFPHVRHQVSTDASTSIFQA